jgi:hypothetical protein
MVPSIHSNRRRPRKGMGPNRRICRRGTTTHNGRQTAWSGKSVPNRGALLLRGASSSVRNALRRQTDADLCTDRLSHRGGWLASGARCAPPYGRPDATPKDDQAVLPWIRFVDGEEATPAHPICGWERSTSSFGLNGNLVPATSLNSFGAPRVTRDTWSFVKRDFRDDRPDLGRIIFGGSEYVKDGLLPLTAPRATPRAAGPSRRRPRRTAR